MKYVTIFHIIQLRSYYDCNMARHLVDWHFNHNNFV